MEPVYKGAKPRRTHTKCIKEFAEFQAALVRLYCPKLVGKALKPWPPRPLVKTWGAAARVTPLWMVTAPMDVTMGNPQRRPCKMGNVQRL